MVDIQKVEVKQKSKWVASTCCLLHPLTHRSPWLTKFLVRLAITYCVIETVVWLRSDDFKKRTSEYKRRANESPSEKHKRLQQLSRQEAEGKAIVSRNGSSKPDALSESAPGTGSITQLTTPIWFRERKREFFQETDPEWQSFLQFQQDQSKVNEVYTKLYETVTMQMNSPRHALQLQYIGFLNSIAANFELIIPIFRPIAYEVPCISVTPEWKVDFGWLALPPSSSANIERMFHPVVFWQAFLAGVKAFSFTTFYITKARILDQYHGAKPTSMVVSMVQKGDQKIITDIVVEKNLSHEQQMITQLPMNQMSQKHAKLNLPFLRGEPAADSVMKMNYRNVVSSITYSDAIEHASGVFKQTWLDKQTAAVQDTTTGVVLIKGHLDCFGERGRYRVEVVAFYLPSQDAFVGKPQITSAFIIQDLTGVHLKESMEAAQSAPVQLHPRKQGHPDKTPSVHQPPSPAEKPTPNEDPGK